MNEWTEMFSNWLKEGKEDSESLLDIPWDLEIKKVEGPKAAETASPPPSVPPVAPLIA